MKEWQEDLRALRVLLGSIGMTVAMVSRGETLCGAVFALITLGVVVGLVMTR